MVQRTGTMLFLPNYPDLGWGTYSALGEDVKKVIELLIREKAEESTLEDFPTIIPVGKTRHPWGVVAFKGEGGIVFIAPVHNSLRSNYMYYQSSPTLAPTSVVKKPVNVNILLEEMLRGSDTVYALLGDEKLKLGRAQKGVENTFKIDTELRKGTYTIELVGDDGGIYTIAGLVVSGLDVDISPNFNNNTLKLVFKIGGVPTKLDDVVISINGKTITYSNVKSVEIDLIKLLGDVPVGEYTVTVKSGGETVTKVFYKKPQTGLSRLLSPTNLVILLLSFVIYIAGLVFAKKEEEKYNIVVPDIIPLVGKTVKLKKSQIIQLFEEVNKFYKWHYMPLKAKELVAGLKNGLIGVKAIVGEYNMNYVLDKLVEKGMLDYVLGYYLPKSWSSKSGFSSAILALFRKVRDIAVSHVIPFTTRISSSQPYHMKLKVLWQDVYIYFYTKREDLKYILKNAPSYIKKGLVFIVVPSEEIKEDLLDSLRGSGRGLKALQLALRTGSLFIMTVDELAAKIKELKGG